MTNASSVMNGLTATEESEFKRISANVCGDAGVDSDDLEAQLAGCDCPPGFCTSSPSCSCIELSGRQRHYDDDGRLIATLDASKPIFECSPNCLCYDSENTTSCRNRVVQRGDSPKVQVIYSDVDGIGRGLRALTRIECGEFVAEYLGEVISHKVAQERISRTADKQHNYLFTIREFFNGEFHRTYIDARNFGGVARFINHSCAPNLQPQIVRIGAITPRIALFALRSIEPGVELGYDYGFAVQTTTPLSTQNQETKSAKPCRCGAPNCRGLLPSFTDDHL